MTSNVLPDVNAFIDQVQFKQHSKLIKLTKTELPLLLKLLPPGYTLTEVQKTTRVHPRLHNYQDHAYLSSHAIPSNVSLSHPNQKQVNLPPKIKSMEEFPTIEEEAKIIKEVCQLLELQWFGSILQPSDEPQKQELQNQTDAKTGNFMYLLNQEFGKEIQSIQDLKNTFNKFVGKTAFSMVKNLDQSNKINDFKALFKKTLHRKILGLESTFFPTQLFKESAEKIEELSKGQKKVLQFTKSTNPTDSCDASRNEQLSLLSKMLAQLPTFLHADILTHLPASTSPIDLSSLSLESIKTAINYCRSKLYQIDPRHPNYRPSSLYRQGLLDQLNPKKIKESKSNEKTETMEVELNEVVSESSFISQIEN